jgi:hypothetical protein
VDTAVGKMHPHGVLFKKINKSVNEIDSSRENSEMAVRGRKQKVSLL